MKIEKPKSVCFISDTHGIDVSSEVQECDILCIAGDISPNNDPHTIESQERWFKSAFIDHLHNYLKKAISVVFCGGNHDRYLYSCHLNHLNEEIYSLLPLGCYYLCNDSVELNGVKIYGNPWCNAPSWAKIGGPFWNFASHNQEYLGKLYADIPDDVDIIITHGPAYGYADQILDQGVLASAFEMYKNTLNAEHLGCRQLKSQIEKIASNREKILYVLSGHIHSAEHMLDERGNIKFACCSILNEGYSLGDYSPLMI